MSAPRRVWAWALLATALAGCPAPGDKTQGPKQVCTKLGQSCEFSPGKLGTCVARDDCATGNCLQCQSQH